MASIQPAKRRDPLIGELLRDYGFKTERELRTKLREATAWLDECGFVLDTRGEDDGARFHSAELGRAVSRTNESVQRLEIAYATGDAAYESAAHRRLLSGALALFLMTHPVTRRQIESGRHEQGAA
jgi:hypothetical protein